MKNFFECTPDDITLSIFKQTSLENLSHLSRVCKKFNFIANNPSSEFKSICDRIESDLNFQPSIGNKELFNLVIDENGNSRYSPRKSALVLQPSTIKINLGKLFQIKIADKGFIDADSDVPVWHIDSFIILVRKDGSVSIYNQKDNQKPDFEHPLTHLNYENFLNRECLHEQQHQYVKG